MCCLLEMVFQFFCCCLLTICHNPNCQCKSCKKTKKGFNSQSIYYLWMYLIHYIHSEYLSHLLFLPFLLLLLLLPWKPILNELMLKLWGFQSDMKCHKITAVFSSEWIGSYVASVFCTTPSWYSCRMVQCETVRVALFWISSSSFLLNQSHMEFSQ